jgi:hypothetical protein
MIEVSAYQVTDPEWLGEQLEACARLYGRAEQATLGVLWWYSASSVFLGPAVSGRDPALKAMMLRLQPDGRLIEATSYAAFAGDFAELGERIRDMLATSIASVSAVSGARPRTLWAIATDSLANRLLWAGAPELAIPMSSAIGPELPRPRYVQVNGRQFVQRASCCLIYQATGGAKCTSCPRQTPAERLARLTSHRNTFS